MDVTVGYRHISGDRFVEEDESEMIAIQHFEVDGRWISADVATLSNDGPFLRLTLTRSTENYPYIESSVREIDELRDSLTPGDWLIETDEENLVLPVSRLRWVELVTA